jgi:replication fork protection complex subunit Tof1/Swi1
LILLLFRNFLSIKDTSSSLHNSTEKEWKSNLQEQLVRELNKAEMFPLFLALAGSALDRPYSDWNFIVQEIFYYIFIDRDVADILSDQVQKGRN